MAGPTVNEWFGLAVGLLVLSMCLAFAAGYARGIYDARCVKCQMDKFDAERRNGG